MKKDIKLRLDEAKAQQLKDNAARAGKSVNAYVEDILSREGNLKVLASEPAKQEKGMFRLTLSADEMQTLYDKAAEAGMTPREFVKSLIANEHLVKIDIVTEDFDELLDAMYTLTKTFNGLMAPIQRSGAFPKDVEKLITLHTELNNAINQIYVEQRDSRNRLYQEVRKKILSDVKDNKYKARKKKGE